MDHTDNDLLLSAYLDSELTAEERGHVEQLLASSTEARQLVDELRALRASLQELPQHTLELEFAQRVLERAEREMNAERIALAAAESTSANAVSTEAAAMAKPPSIDPAAVDEALSVSPMKSGRPADSSDFGKQLRRALTNRRGLRWSFVAIAVALVIMISNRQPPEDHRPAARPEGEDKVATAPATPPARGLSAPENQSPANMPRPSNNDFAASSPATGQADNLKVADVPALRSSPLADRAEQQTPVAPGSDGLVNERMDRLDDAIVAATKRPAGANPTGQSDLAETAGKLAAGKESKSIDDHGELLVIQVSLSPEAARRGIFDQLLAKNHIAMDESQSNRDSLVQRFDRNGVAAREQSERVPHLDEIATDDRVRNRSEAEQVQREGLAELNKDQAFNYYSTTPESSRSVDLVYVEASPDQIDGTLADLCSTPQEFPSVILSANGPNAEVGFKSENQLRSRSATDATDQETVARGALRGWRGGGGRGFGVGGQAGGSRGSFGGGGFGNGGIDGPMGRKSLQTPATESSADEKTKAAELKKSNETIDPKAAGSEPANSDFNRFGEMRKLQVNAAPGQTASAPGRAERLKAPELGQSLGLDIELARPRDESSSQSNSRPKADANSDKYLRRKDGGGAVDSPAKQAMSSPSAPPGGTSAASGAGAAASAVTPLDKSAMGRGDSSNSATLSQQDTPSDDVKRDLTRLSVGSNLAGVRRAPSNESRTPDGAVASSTGRRRALFVLRVLDTPAAAKPAAESTAPASAGRQP